MYDAEDPGTVLNEFLLSLFVPGIIIFVALWASFRLSFNGLLLSYGLPPLTPADGAGTIATGFGRMLLLIVLSAIVLVPYLGFYIRFLRKPLREQGIV